MDDLRKRLKKKDAEAIAKWFRDQGLESWSRRDHVGIQCGSRYVWLVWSRRDQGWELRMQMQNLYTEEDLKTLLGELEWGKEPLELIDETWQKYKRTKSEKAWNEYQGALAAFLMKVGR